ncbi:MAG: HEAT repeat domain-containing protein [Planctomycetes bacterium]|nr:HEAT repeat domain-containing protein [Planctomycetota bacterium]
MGGSRGQPQPGTPPAPPPPPTRPGLGVGLQPRLATLRTVLSNGQPGSLRGLVEPWEIWWTNNREKYLDFRQPVNWFKIVGRAGETKSVTTFRTREQLLDILVKGLEDTNDTVAWCAAVALGKTGESMAIKPLKKAYQTDNRILLRNNSALALGMLGDKAALDFIKNIAANNMNTYSPRCYGIAGLGFINDPAAIDVLNQLTGDRGPNKETEIIVCAALALGLLKDASAVPVLGELLNGPNKTDTRIRVYAALGLGRIGHKASYDQLKKAITDKDKDVRAAIMVALTLMPDVVDRKDLLPVLKDKEPTVRGLAAIGLAQITARSDDKTKDTVYEEFTKALEENKGNDAAGLITLAMGLLGNGKAKPELRKTIETKENKPLAKSVAALALGLLKDTEAVPLIIDALKKEPANPRLAPYLILALGMIPDAPAGQSEEAAKPTSGTNTPATVSVNAETPKDISPVDALKELWAKADKNVSGAAYTNLAVALTMLGKRDELVIPQLIKHAAKDAEPQRSPDRSVGADPILRTYALHTIGLVGNREAADSFITGYNDEPDDNVRNAAVNGIGFLLDKNPTPLLTKWTGDNVDILTLIIEHLIPIQPW